MKSIIPFNKPFLSGKEIQYIEQAVRSGKISGNGSFTLKCQTYFEKRYKYLKCLLTNSCTAALEMAAILLNIQPGDEVIMPSYTFVSTANAFILRGAKIIFVDSHPSHPGINEDKIEELISPRTRAIVPVHYGGVACNMSKIMALARKYELFVVEDAAQAINSFFTDEEGQTFPLGGIGHLAALSFHETKNIQCGEGGMLIINDERFVSRAEILWEKGTNRAAFQRGAIQQYEWIDVGSSFLPSEVTAAFLWAQLEKLDEIQQLRRRIWNEYWDGIMDWAADASIKMPFIPDYASNNTHLFYLVCHNNEQRTDLIRHLKLNGVQAIFHYLSLHKSPYYIGQHGGRELPEADRYSANLMRLPFYNELSEKDSRYIINIFGAMFK